MAWPFIIAFFSFIEHVIFVMLGVNLNIHIPYLTINMKLVKV